MQSITINIQPAGSFCNIHCGYCDLAYRSGSVREFDFNAFEVALLDIVKDDPCSVTFVLHGGEPLTADLGVLIRIIDLCEKYFGENSRVQLQTNGVLLTDDISKSLLERHCGFSVSMDPDLGNRRYDRVTRETVKNNICQLIQSGADVGVVSVVHAHNLEGFSSMLHELCEMEASAWTINRIRSDVESPFYISEKTYVKLLLSVMQEWIGKRLFRSIRILPLLDLLTSHGGNHCCRYSNHHLKCHSFYVFDGEKMTYHCEHLAEQSRMVEEKCLCCEDYDFCGGGCPGELKDPSFCQARQMLKKAILDLKINYGGSR